MGSDYHYRKPVGTDARTGYPTDEYGHLLDREDGGNGEYRELTSPYGALTYAIGSGDDFWCFDYAVAHEQWIVLHATINSETGSFIEDASYDVLPLNEAPGAALGLTDQAREWCAVNNVRHTRKGWNQDWFYFYRSVVLAAQPSTGRTFSDRERRYGSKGIRKLTTF